MSSFKIIRNDITRVAADAIVNTANPEPTYDSGTDAAIYHAAGVDALLAARRKIGAITPGEAAATPAFNLDAKFIIHTVGPVWRGGAYHEEETLRSCYRKSLALAEQLGCTSIAFPLISTGVYGFPKDQALEAALSEISKFLEESELDVTLVVFGYSSFQLASGLTESIQSYIDENYVEKRLTEEYGDPSESRQEVVRRRREIEWRRRRLDAAAYDDRRIFDSEPSAEEEDDDSWGFDREKEESAPGYYASKKKKTLDEIVSQTGESFQAMLLRMLDERGLTPPDVYKKANVDRKVFSKITCNEGYIPKKKTILSLALAMRLNLQETKELLASAGHAIMRSSLADVIVQYCIEEKIYDICRVNAILFDRGEPELA